MISTKFSRPSETILLARKQLGWQTNRKCNANPLQDAECSGLNSHSIVNRDCILVLKTRIELKNC